jgi:hypothetical protein
MRSALTLVLILVVCRTRGEHLSRALEWPQLRIFWGRSVPHIFDRGWVYQRTLVSGEKLVPAGNLLSMKSLQQLESGTI